MTGTAIPGGTAAILLVGSRRMEKLADRMRSVAPGADIAVAATAAEGEAHLARARIVVLADRATPAYARARLAWMHLYPTGIDHVSIPELRDASFPMTHKAVGSVVPMAEHAFALMLSAARRLADYRDLQRAADWRHYSVWPATSLGQLAGRTLAIVGMGGVGRALARRAKAFDMRVVAVTRSPGAPSPEVDRLAGPDGLHAALGEADFVIVCVSLNDSTYRLIDAAALAAMQPGAWFINVSRGPVVDHAALLAAVAGKQIAGAALDVFDTEPLASGDPAWSMPNVIVTPHVAGSGPDNEEDATREILDNLRRFLAGEPLRHRVDPRDVPTRAELLAG